MNILVVHPPLTVAIYNNSTKLAEVILTPSAALVLIQDLITGIRSQ